MADKLAKVIKMKVQLMLEENSKEISDFQHYSINIDNSQPS